MSTLYGTVASGRGLATAAQSVFESKVAGVLGAKPAPGTLNLILDRPVELRAEGADLSAGCYLFYRCTFLGEPSLCVRILGWPRHVAEIVSATHFRSECDVQDGATYPLTLPAARAPTIGKHAIWALLWAGRRKLFYTGYGEFLYRHARSLTRI